MSDVREVLEILPHRFPFLMVDRIVSREPGKKLVAIKNVTFNEAHFSGHFPNDPVMPGVLVVEALAQAAVLLAHGCEHGFDPTRHNVYLLGIDGFRFRRAVRPGDQLRLEVEPLRTGSKVWKIRGVAKVGEEVVAEGEMLASFGDRTAT